MIKNLMSIWGRMPDVIPATEPMSAMPVLDLVRGSNYIIKESRPDASLEIFMSLVNGRCPGCDHPEAFPCESIGCEGCTLSCPCKGCCQARAQGLCFTMLSPEEVRMKCTLQTTPIFWISNRGDDSIRPSALEVIADMVDRFLKRSRNAVILLDGIEYLAITNGFITMLKFLRDIEEGVILHGGILLLPVNPTAMDEKEMALLERSTKEIPINQRERF